MNYTSACSISNITGPVHPNFPTESSFKNISNSVCFWSGQYCQRDSWRQIQNWLSNWNVILTENIHRALVKGRVEMRRNDLLVWTAAKGRQWNGPLWCLSILLVLWDACQWEDQNHTEYVPVHPLSRASSYMNRASAFGCWLFPGINLIVNMSLSHRGYCLTFFALPKHSCYAK